jgi:nitrite reductase/ring-hydroxylating ferredoxin subunit
MDSNIIRKKEIKARLNLKKFPRKSQAVFLDENDHNPLVLENCPKCNGHGTYCIESPGMAIKEYCEECEGSGVTGNIVHYYQEELSEVEVLIDEGGWLICPRCEWKFTIRDGNVWTGKRHKRCGQKIKVVVEGRRIKDE